MSGRRAKAVRRFVAWWGRRGTAPLTEHRVVWDACVRNYPLDAVTFGESPAVRRKIEREVRRRRTHRTPAAPVVHLDPKPVNAPARTLKPRSMGHSIRAAMLLAALSFPGAR